jgi:hypothetical protein
MPQLNQKRLNTTAKKLAQKIISTKKNISYFEEPYKFLVLDDFLPRDLAESALRKFPNLSSSCWEFQNTKDLEIKYRTVWKSEFDIPEHIVDIVRILNSSILLTAISKRFCIKKLIPDSYFTGGGLNAMRRSGVLDVHVDGNYHDATGLNRRMNVILFLNKSWKNNWGGDFGIYDNDGEICKKRILPIFNRLVIFDTHDKSFHGMPEKLNCPKNRIRKSLILYYYTKESRPRFQITNPKPHSALWKKNDFKDKFNKKTRKYF